MTIFEKVELYKKIEIGQIPKAESCNSWKTMAANIRVNIPKSQTKYAKAMVQRSRHALKEELKNIDSEYSKSLFNLNKDLEETRNTLKALRVSQKQARRNSVVCKQGINISSFVPTPPLMRRRRASSFPYETHDQLKSVQRCRSSKARPPVRSRKNVETKTDRKKDKITTVYDQLNGRKSQTNMNDTGEATEEEKEEEVEMNEKQRETRESEQPDETKSLISFSAFDTFEVASDLRMKMEEIQEGVGSKVAEGLETSNAESLSTNIAVVQEDLGTKMTTRGSQDLDSHVPDDLGTSKLTVDQLKEPGNESNLPSKQSSPGNEVDEKLVDEQETNIQETLRNSWPNDDYGKKETVDKYSLFVGNKANMSSKKRIFARRASSPDIMIPLTRTEPVLNRPKTGFFRCPPNLTVQHETNNTSAKALQKLVSTRRVSSPDLMSTVPGPEKSKPSLLGRATSSTYESNKDNISPQRKRLLARRASSPDLLTIPGLEKFKTSPGRPGGLSSTHETNKDSTSTGTTRRRRRASSPNLMSPEDALKFSFEHRQHLTSIQELTHGNAWMEISPPLEKPPPSRTRARRSSIAVMTGVVNPLVLGPPTPMSVFHSLPDIKTRDSIQENQVQDSLRKISRRLTTPLTGAQLEKRLQAHRVDAAALQTKVACTPESKAPNKLEMSDLQHCRYLRRRSISE